MVAWGKMLKISKKLRFVNNLLTFYNVCIMTFINICVASIYATFLSGAQKVKVGNDEQTQKYHWPIAG